MTAAELLFPLADVDAAALAVQGMIDAIDAGLGTQSVRPLAFETTREESDRDLPK